jgi:hypothetical protein
VLIFLQPTPQDIVVRSTISGKTTTGCGQTQRRKVINVLFYTPMGYILTVNSFIFSKTTSKSRSKVVSSEASNRPLKRVCSNFCNPACSLRRSSRTPCPAFAAPVHSSNPGPPPPRRPSPAAAFLPPHLSDRLACGIATGGSRAEVFLDLHCGRAHSHRFGGADGGTGAFWYWYAAPSGTS